MLAEKEEPIVRVASHSTDVAPSCLARILMGTAEQCLFSISLKHVVASVGMSCLRLPSSECCLARGWQMNLHPVDKTSEMAWKIALRETIDEGKRFTIGPMHVHSLPVQCLVRPCLAAKVPA